MSVIDFLDTYLPPKLRERTIVAITSKVVSLCEGRLVPPSEASKEELVKREAQRYLAGRHPHGFTFTVTNNTLVPSAGIDESNAGGGYLLWPADPQATANSVREHLRARFGLKRAGVLITDSTCSPLRRGTAGICLAHSGFRAVNNYVGKPDLFGRRFKVSQANVAGGLAAAAVLVMGEGSERTPICVIQGTPLVRFQGRNPTEAELEEIRITPEEDLFSPFLAAVAWETGGGSARVTAAPGRPAFVLRRYRATDGDAIWALHNLALAGTGAHLGDGAWDDDLRRVEAAYLEAGGEFLVGEVDGEVVAMGALQRKDDLVATIRRMRVAPSWQHRGYGSTVLHALEARAAELGYQKLVLDTTTAQAAAMSFYAAHGYTETGRAQLRGLTVVYFEKAQPGFPKTMDIQ